MNPFQLVKGELYENRYEDENYSLGCTLIFMGEERSTYISTDYVFYNTLRCEVQKWPHWQVSAKDFNPL